MSKIACQWGHEGGVESFPLPATKRYTFPPKGGEGKDHICAGGIYWSEEQLVGILIFIVLGLRSVGKGPKRTITSAVTTHLCKHNVYI